MSEINSQEPETAAPTAKVAKPAKPAKPRKEKSIPDSAAVGKGPKPNPSWFAPTMVGFFIAGLFWIITYYISLNAYPLGTGSPIDLGPGNILTGFGLIMVGFVMSSRWR